MSLDASCGLSFLTAAGELSLGEGAGTEIHLTLQTGEGVVAEEGDDEFEQQGSAFVPLLRQCIARFEGHTSEVI